MPDYGRFVDLVNEVLLLSFFTSLVINLVFGISALLSMLEHVYSPVF